MDDMQDHIEPFDGMLQRIDDLVVRAGGYTPVTMVDLATLRVRFKEERVKRGLKQEWVASRGRVDQSQISKLESTDPYMPSLDTFLRAVYGLNMTAAEFLAPIEGLQILPASSTHGAALVTDAASTSFSSSGLDETLQAFILDLIDKLQDLLAAHRRRQERAAAKTARKTRRPRRA